MRQMRAPVRRRLPAFVLAVATCLAPSHARAQDASPDGATQPDARQPDASPAAATEPATTADPDAAAAAAEGTIRFLEARVKEFPDDPGVATRLAAALLE